MPSREWAAPGDGGVGGGGGGGGIGGAGGVGGAAGVGGKNGIPRPDADTSGDRPTPASSTATRTSARSVMRATGRCGAQAGRPRHEAPDFAPDSVAAEDVLANLTVGWQRLCEDERDSVIAATFVAGIWRGSARLRRFSARPRSVIEDEIRHVAVCSEVLDRLGAAARDVPAAQRRQASGNSDPDVRSPAPSRRVRGRRADVRGELLRRGAEARARSPLPLGVHRAAPRRNPPRQLRHHRR